MLHRNMALILIVLAMVVMVVVMMMMMMMMIILRQPRTAFPRGRAPPFVYGLQKRASFRDRLQQVGIRIGSQSIARRRSGYCKS